MVFPSSADDAAATPPPECADPATQFGAACACFEDDTAYFGNNRVVGSENPQPSRDGRVPLRYSFTNIVVRPSIEQCEMVHLKVGPLGLFWNSEFRSRQT